MFRATVSGMAMVLVALACCAAPAPATHVECGDTATSSVTLDSDLLDCPGDGIVVGADSVTIDLGGHVIDGTLAGNGIQAAERQAVTVRNGTIRDFRQGVYSHYQGELFVTGMTIALNQQNGVFSYGDRVSVTDSRVVNNGINGVLASGHAEITSSHLSGNARGVAVGAGVAELRGNSLTRNDIGVMVDAAYGLIEANTIAENRTGVYTYEGSASVLRNRIVGNADAGIEDGHLSGGSIKHNVIARNGVGTSLHGSLFGPIEGNHVYRNTEEGLTVGLANRVASNRVHDNGRGGIDIGTYICPHIEDNIVFRNGGDGILLSGYGTDCYQGEEQRLLRNYASRNEGDGIRVVDSETSLLLEGNRTHRNRDDGIDVGPARGRMDAPSWHPSGTEIAVSVEFGYWRKTIWSIPVDGGAGRGIVGGEQPDWSPDASALAFAREDPYADRGIFVAEQDGSGAHKVAAGGSSPRWAPTGEAILFDRDGAVWKVAVSGGDPIRLATGAGARWSPDGSRIAFSAPGGLGIMDSDGTNLHQVAGVGGPSWSPDGAHLAYQAPHELGTLAADGSDRRPIVTDPSANLYYPAWSPRGDRIAFLRSQPDPFRLDVYGVNPDGSGLKAIRERTHFRFPIWSPDGTQIMLASNCCGSGVSVMNSDGSGHRELEVSANPLATFRANRADRNADLGIEAAVGVTDAGGNRARHNGDPRQCVNVFCR